MFGAIAVEDRPWTEAPAEDVARAALEGLRADGLALSPAAARLRARILLARAEGAGVPDVSDAALLAGEALLPWLGKARSLADLRSLDLTEALRNLVGWAGMAEVDRIAPAHFTTPLGRAVPIDYDGPAPSIEVRLQELFGVTRHPVAGGRPLRITLLSPGARPVQVTQDLPGFWANSYADVRRDMRGRYPRHPWPEDPTQADPTTRAKPRGT
jgi:ATP-dependent helicase HrpB